MEKKNWSSFQDVLLAQAAVQYDKQWGVIAEGFGRSAKECSDRYNLLSQRGLPRVSPRKRSPIKSQNFIVPEFDLSKSKRKKKPLVRNKQQISTSSPNPFAPNTSCNIQSNNLSNVSAILDFDNDLGLSDFKQNLDPILENQLYQSSLIPTPIQNNPLNVIDFNNIDYSQMDASISQITSPINELFAEPEIVPLENYADQELLNLIQWNASLDVPNLVSNTSPTNFLDAQKPDDYSDLFDEIPDDFPQPNIQFFPNNHTELASSPPTIFDEEDDDEAEFMPNENEISDEDSENDNDQGISRIEMDELYMENLEAVPQVENSGEPSKINWVNPKSQIFSWDQIHRIQSQLQQAVQLSIQAYAISSQLFEASKSDVEYWKSRLNVYQLMKNQSLCRIRKSLFDMTAIDKIPKILALKTDFNSQPSKEFRKEHQNTARGLSERKKEKKNRSAENIPFVNLPKAIISCIEEFPDFDHQLLPRILPVPFRSRFLETEDDLLLLGLQNFGLHDLHSIRAYYLPPRTIKEIKIRLGNIKHGKRGKKNTKSPIKDFILLPFKPLNESEKQLMFFSINIFGKDFRDLISLVFNYIPDAILKASWQEMYNQGRVRIPWEDKKRKLINYAPSSEGYLASSDNEPRWNSDLETDNEVIARPLITLAGKYDGSSGEEEDSQNHSIEYSKEPTLAISMAPARNKRRRRKMVDIVKAIHTKHSPEMLAKEGELIYNISKFNAPIRYAVAYGSGAYQQKGYDGKTVGKDTMLDFIFGVTHPQHWHSLNLRQHPSHYSLVGKLGAGWVTSIQKGFGGQIYYNPDVIIDGVRIKYGVVSMDDLLEDLTAWKTLYLAGRLHKPVKIIRDDARMRLASHTNLTNALRVALLMLPEKFSSQDLFLKIAGLSYRGDFRMRFIENPYKVYNIVYAQEDAFREKYAPIIDELPNINPINFDTFEQDMTDKMRVNLILSLPKRFQSLIVYHFKWYLAKRGTIKLDVDEQELLTILVNSPGLESCVAKGNIH